MSKTMASRKKAPPHLYARDLPPLRRRYPDGPVVVAMMNEGGGTRKSTDGVNVAASLASAGYRTGLIDGDQTMAASCYLGYGVTDKKNYPDRVEQVYARLADMPNVYDVLHGRLTLKDALLPARTRVAEGDDDDAFETIPNLYLVLGSREMAQASEDLRNVRKADANTDWLRRSVSQLPSGTLDFLIVDGRGTFDTLESSELAGSDFVVGCVKPDRKDDDTLASLHALIDQTKRAYEFSGGSADMRYVLINGTRPRNQGKFYVDFVTEIEAFYGDMVLPTISESVEVAESVDAQEPLMYWSPSHKARTEFDHAAQVLAKDVDPSFSIKRWKSSS